MLQIFIQGITYSIITLHLHVLYLKDKVLFGECRQRTEACYSLCCRKITQTFH